jgi:hypothetical protein
MGPPKKNLYEEGLHYDLLMPGPNDLPFYQRQVAKYGTPVLELGSGSGRLSIPLAAAGVQLHHAIVLESPNIPDEWARRRQSTRF